LKNYIINHKEWILMHVDLHAHANKRGAFVFSNHIDDETKYLDSILLPRCAALNSINFDFLECNFSKEGMVVKDKAD